MNKAHSSAFVLYLTYNINIICFILHKNNANVAKFLRLKVRFEMQELILSQEVKQALQEKKPIVALESTIISHGLPEPLNFKMAQHVESIIRSNGAIPATIAIIEGKIHVGLNEDQLLLLAKSDNVLKVSRSDLAYVVSQGFSGATTVAATMIIANKAGIKLFVTGGIGGVHQDHNSSMDVSADLEELARTSVVVVSAGIKSILDLGKTLEYLETKGVPVIGYKTDYLPAFYSSKSPFKLNLRLDTVTELARFVIVQEKLALTTGVLVTNPLERKFELDYNELAKIIDKSHQKAQIKGIMGKKLTPFLLQDLALETKGKTLKANLELIYSNAKLGARIASKYYKMKQEE
jgi:pseudouridine-5'-phosphate glycosidase